MMRRRKAATEKPRIEELVLEVVEELEELLAAAQAQEKLAAASVRAPVLSAHLMHCSVVPFIQEALQAFPEPAPEVAVGAVQAVQVTLSLRAGEVPVVSYLDEKSGLHLTQLAPSVNQHPVE